jgi:uncharacterized protein YqjF (DUF2071 family)
MWVGHMVWHDLLFAHWPVPASALRPHVPARLEIEQFDGTAWLAIVPFLMTGVRPRWLPAFPVLSRTLELNVRTYVRHRDQQGVYFFSLDAERRVLVAGARATFHLNYLHADMSLQRIGDGRICYESSRVHLGAPPADLRVTYQPAGEPYLSKPGSLEHWLTERYTLFAEDPNGGLIRGDIHHARWPLQRAEAEWEHNRMTEQVGLILPSVPPLLNFAKRLGVRVWAPVRLK